jgi:hypothetical protein
MEWDFALAFGVAIPFQFLDVFSGEIQILTQAQFVHIEK